VTITDPDAETLAGAPSRIAASLKALGATNAESERTQERVRPVNSVAAAVEGAAFVFEATPQALELKQQILAEAELHAPGDAILASNTSVSQIIAIMEPLKHRERALGTLWWNPPHVAPLVEVIKTEWTDPVLADLMAALLATAGKTPVMVEKDLPVFISNQMKHAISQPAFDPMSNAVCSANVVDSLIRSGSGQRLENGEPMEDTDRAGTDLSLDFHGKLLYLSDSRLRQSPCLERLDGEGNSA
jgi:3-hydroxybutyryl-CoA dehydrogenase